MRLPTSFAIFGFLLALRVSALGDTYEIDPALSSVGFTARLVGRPVPGTFSKFSGTVSVDPAHPGMTADAKIDVASIGTDNPKRDRHLLSPDYFDREKFPELTFHGSGVSPGAGGDFDLTGRLTIKGVAKTVTLHVHPIGGAESPAWEATTEVNRKDFGVAHDAMADMAIGDRVEIKLDIHTHRK